MGSESARATPAPPLLPCTPQARAFALARASLSSDMPLTHAPADIAAAALSLAADASLAVPQRLARFGGWCSSEGAPATETGEEGGGGAEAGGAAPPLLDSAPSAVSWCVDAFLLDAMLGGPAGVAANPAAAEVCRRRVADTRAQLRAVALAPLLPASEVSRLTEQLLATVNPQSVPDSEAAALQRRALAAERAAYKRGKQAARARVRRINEDALAGPAAAAAAQVPAVADAEGS